MLSKLIAPPVPASWGGDKPAASENPPVQKLLPEMEFIVGAHQLLLTARFGS
jgi:hypothetical protein